MKPYIKLSVLVVVVAAVLFVGTTNFRAAEAELGEEWFTDFNKALAEA